MRRDGTMDLTVERKSDILARASECELFGPADDFMVECEWKAASYAAALSRFNFLRATLDTCLEVEFESGENTYDNGSGYRVLRRFWGTVEEADGERVDVDLELVESAYGGESPRHAVQLEFSR